MSVASISFAEFVASSSAFTFVAAAAETSSTLSFLLLLFKWSVICKDPLFCLIGRFAASGWPLFLAADDDDDEDEDEYGGRLSAVESRDREGSVFIIVRAGSTVTVCWNRGFGKLLDICSVSPVSRSRAASALNDLFLAKVAAGSALSRGDVWTGVT